MHVPTNPDHPPPSRTVKPNSFCIFSTAPIVPSARLFLGSPGFPGSSKFCANLPFFFAPPRKLSTASTPPGTVGKHEVQRLRPCDVAMAPHRTFALDWKSFGGSLLPLAKVNPSKPAEVDSSYCVRPAPFVHTQHDAWLSLGLTFPDAIASSCR